MTIKIRKQDGTYIGNKGTGGHTDVIIALAEQSSKGRLERFTALTDSSGGTAGATVQKLATLVGAAASGSSLAGKATTETALDKVKDAITELATQTNLMLARLGLTTLTDSSGGAAADLTIAALDVSVTGAATGAVVATTNAIFATIDDAFYELGLKANILAKAVGIAPLTFSSGFATKNGVIAAISTSTGTAADPGVTKVEMDAALVKMAANVKLLATRLNLFQSAAVSSIVVV